MPATDPLQAETGRLRRIWLAFLLAPFLYAIIIGLVNRVDPAADPDLVQWMSIFLGVFAGCEIILVFLARPLIVGLTRDSYTNFCIVRWAMLESIAIYGVIIRFVGGRVTIAACFLALSLALIAITPPKADEAAELQKQWG